MCNHSAEEGGSEDGLAEASIEDRGDDIARSNEEEITREERRRNS